MPPSEIRKDAREALRGKWGKAICIILVYLLVSYALSNIIGKLVIDNKTDILITIGKYSKYIGREAKKLGMKRKNIKHFKHEKDAREYINDIIKENDIILIKGSNGMKLIELVNYLKKL